MKCHFQRYTVICYVGLEDKSNYYFNGRYCTLFQDMLKETGATQIQ